MSQLQALIFDVDGTLAETEDLHREAFNQTFQDFGLAWHWDRPTYIRLLAVTGGKERMRHFIAEDAPPAPGDILEKVPALHQHKTRLYAEAVAAGHLPLRPGVHRLIQEAREAGIGLAIATTTSFANIEALIGATLGPDAMGWFDAIGAGDMVAAKKPAPDVYALALEKLGLPATRCLAVEDSLNGIRSARAAGLEVLVTRSPFTAGDDLSEGTLVVDDLDHGPDGRPLHLSDLSRLLTEAASSSSPPPQP